jgi:4-alpha-glucanotransferase
VLRLNDRADAVMVDQVDAAVDENGAAGQRWTNAAAKAQVISAQLYISNGTLLSLNVSIPEKIRVR